MVGRSRAYMYRAYHHRERTSVQPHNGSCLRNQSQPHSEAPCGHWSHRVVGEERRDKVHGGRMRMMSGLQVTSFDEGKEDSTPYLSFVLSYFILRRVQVAWHREIRECCSALLYG